MKRLFVTFFRISVCLALTSMAGTSIAEPVTIGAEDTSAPVISCLGNSITNGFPYEGTGSTYPAQLLVMLETTYGSGSYEVINHGVNGYRADQVYDALEEFNWLTEDDPGFVLLMVGGNDLAQEIEPDLSNLSEVISNTVNEVQDIVNVVTSHTNADGSHPKIIVSAFPPNRLSGVGGSAVVALYNSSLESNLTGMDLWFTDNWDDFYNPATGQARETLMYDEVHPNDKGYAVMAENWSEAINSLLHHLYLPLVLHNH
jgi:lysophospholipase L1-like esterase